MQSRSEAPTQTQTFAAIKLLCFINVSLPPPSSPSVVIWTESLSVSTLPVGLPGGGGERVRQQDCLRALYGCIVQREGAACRVHGAIKRKEETPRRPPRFSCLHQSRVIKARPIRGRPGWCVDWRWRGGGRQVPQTTWLLIWRSIMRCNGFAALHECTHYSCIVSTPQ